MFPGAAPLGRRVDGAPILPGSQRRSEVQLRALGRSAAAGGSPRGMKKKKKKRDEMANVAANDSPKMCARHVAAFTAGVPSQMTYVHVVGSGRNRKLHFTPPAINYVLRSEMHSHATTQH